jgi:hypothetical protein
VTGYDDERDQVRAGYTDLRRYCRPLPEDTPRSRRDDRFHDSTNDRAGDVTGAEVRGGVSALLGELGRVPHVRSVEDPYSTKGSITPDGRTLVARVYLDVINPNDMPVEDTQRLLAAAEAAERDGLTVALGGRAVQLAEANQSGSEMLGLLATAVILLLVLGSVVAAGLPLAMGPAGGRSVPAWSGGRWASTPKPRPWPRSTPPPGRSSWPAARSW